MHHKNKLVLNGLKQMGNFHEVILLTNKNDTLGIPVTNFNKIMFTYFRYVSTKNDF